MKSSEPKTPAASSNTNTAKASRNPPKFDSVQGLQALADASPAVQRLANLADQQAAQRVEDEETQSAKADEVVEGRRQAAPPITPPAADPPVQAVSRTAQRVGDVAQLEGGGLPSNINDMVARVEAGKGNLGTRGKGGQPSYSANGVTYQGGRTFGNREKKLPENLTYQEWDVRPLTSGNRGGERLITGSDGSVWYTGDHYSSFTKVK